MSVDDVVGIVFLTVLVVLVLIDQERRIHSLERWREDIEDGQE